VPELPPEEELPELLPELRPEPPELPLDPPVPELPPELPLTPPEFEPLSPVPEAEPLLVALDPDPEDADPELVPPVPGPDGVLPPKPGVEDWPHESNPSAAPIKAHSNVVPTLCVRADFIFSPLALDRSSGRSCVKHQTRRRAMRDASSFRDDHLKNSFCLLKNTFCHLKHTFYPNAWLAAAAAARRTRSAHAAARAGRPRSGARPAAGRQGPGPTRQSAVEEPTPKAISTWPLDVETSQDTSACALAKISMG
jgi:hypothetical protein